MQMYEKNLDPHIEIFVLLSALCQSRIFKIIFYNYIL